MLARPNRLTRGSDYQAVVRRGRRTSAKHVVSYVREGAADCGPRFGFIVSRQVGSAVTRNTVRRRLKAVCAELRTSMNRDVDVVLRALPDAALPEYGTLRDDVHRSLRRVLR